MQATTKESKIIIGNNISDKPISKANRKQKSKVSKSKYEKMAAAIRKISSPVGFENLKKFYKI